MRVAIGMSAFVAAHRIVYAGGSDRGCCHHDPADLRVDIDRELGCHPDAADTHSVSRGGVAVPAEQ